MQLGENGVGGASLPSERLTHYSMVSGFKDQGVQLNGRTGFNRGKSHKHSHPKKKNSVDFEGINKVIQSEQRNRVIRKVGNKGLL